MSERGERWLHFFQVSEFLFRVVSPEDKLPVSWSFFVISTGIQVLKFCFLGLKGARASAKSLPWAT